MHPFSWIKYQLAHTKCDDLSLFVNPSYFSTLVPDESTEKNFSPPIYASLTSPPRQRPAVHITTYFTNSHTFQDISKIFYLTNSNNFQDKHFLRPSTFPQLPRIEQRCTNCLNAIEDVDIFFGMLSNLQKIYAQKRRQNIRQFLHNKISWPQVNYAYLRASNARASFVKVPEKFLGKNTHLARVRVMGK